MLRHLCLFLTTAFLLSASFRPISTPRGGMPQTADTLTAGVYSPKPVILKGATRDLADLDIQLISVPAGQVFDAENNRSTYLVIVKTGSIVISAKTLGPGGIGLFDTMPYISNPGKTNAAFYLFSFQSRSDSGGRIAPDFMRNWSELTMKPTPKGESRAIFSQQTARLKNINMHATTLNPGEISHPQHMHRAEEILILRSGSVRMHIANGYIPAKGGDIVFLPSGVPHDLENGTTGRTEYFALQWEQ